MKITHNQALEIAHNPEVHCSMFDDQKMRDFIGIWETRRMMAIEHHKRDDLRLLAEGVLHFVKNRRPDRLRLYGVTKGKDSIGFLFDMQTEEHFQII